MRLAPVRAFAALVLLVRAATPVLILVIIAVGPGCITRRVRKRLSAAPVGAGHLLTAVAQHQHVGVSVRHVLEVQRPVRVDHNAARVGARVQV